MKKILKYIFLLIIVYFVVNLFINFITKPYYREFDNYEILTTNPKVEITECKNSNLKGYIKGRVTNTTGMLIEDAAVQVKLYKKNGEFLGTEYHEIPYFTPQEEANFEVHYSYKDVSNIKVSIVKRDSKELGTITIEEMEGMVPAFVLTIILLVL